MNCSEIRELMPDLAAGVDAARPEVNNHLQACSDCAGKLNELRQTMALLDEWQAPEPSPYFDVRLQARLREEATKQPSGWRVWLRKPALAACFVVLLAASIMIVRNDNGRMRHNDQTVANVQAEPGTAVGDLQALERNHDLYSDYEILDDLQAQQDENLNP